MGEPSNTRMRHVWAGNALLAAGFEDAPAECSCFTPVASRIALAMARAVDAPTNRILRAEFVTVPGELPVVRLDFAIDAKAAAEMVALIGAIDPEKSR